MSFNQHERRKRDQSVQQETVGHQGTARVHIQSADDVLVARQAGRALASGIGFSTIDVALVTLAISEIAGNIVKYAGDGDITIEIIDRLDGDVTGDTRKTGIQIVASDQGPGIPDVAIAMRDFYSTGAGLGVGLPGVRRLMDEFEITSKAGQGTMVWMRRWV
jgi:serine/threonine-protein kinase RsbT